MLAKPAKEKGPRLNIQVTNGAHINIRIKAAKKGVTIQALLQPLIEDFAHKPY